MTDNRWGAPRADGSHATWGLPYPTGPEQARDEARAKLAEVRALAETWHYRSVLGWSPRQEGSASAELLDILNAPVPAGVSREATP